MQVREAFADPTDARRVQRGGGQLAFWPNGQTFNVVL